MAASLFFRNLLVSLLVLLLAGSVVEAGLPGADHVEAYLAFVLTTDFDYRSWLERLAGWTGTTLESLRDQARTGSWLPGGEGPGWLGRKGLLGAGR